MIRSGLIFTVLVVAFAILLGEASKGQAQADTPRVSTLVCTLSAFFTADSAQVYRPRAHVEGRGLASCRNDQGFESDAPVLVSADLDWKADGNRTGEFAFSANSAPFVITREIGQINDVYTAGPLPSTNAPDAAEPSFLMRGARHDVLIEIRLNSRTAALSGLQLRALKLSFDESAPDLAPNYQ